MSELNERVTFTVGSSTTLTVPIDTTLTIEGQAADAAAVGRALAGKQDAGSVVISVNGQEQDNQGQIEITGEDIPVDETAGADSIADAIAELQGRTGEDIPVSGSEATTIKGKLDALQDAVGDAQDDIDGLTAAGIPYDGTVAEPVSIKATVDGIAGSISAIGSKTAADIVYDGTAQTPQSIKATVDGIQQTVQTVGAKTAADITYDGTAQSPQTIKAAVDAVAASVAGMTGNSMPIDSSAGAATVKATIEGVAAGLVKVAEVRFNQGVPLIVAPGNDDNVVTITSSMAGVDLSSITLLAVNLFWAWPLGTWENGAIVTVNNCAISSGNIVVHLATSYAQSYMLGFRILYV